MKASILAVATLWCCIGAGMAFADGAPTTNHKRGPAGIAVGESLVAARNKLVKQGWRPTRMHATDGYEYSRAELQLTARKFIEVDSCSSDSSRCILFYAKNGVCLRVDTIGEKLNDMTVTRWAVECPGAPPKPSRAAAE
ncbi:phage tail sheath gpL-like [Rhodanobacter sp. MP7CTX1]|nr:phage tail sheath gpL-like [Rhodanobacter sp. MP7CTX1]